MSIEAELYAATHCGTPGDVAFYRRVARGASRVLELGCGDARVLVALAADGLLVIGLERDAGLLELAQARLGALAPEARARVELVRGDMRELRLEQRFERIFIPYNGIYCLASEDELVACLARARGHLTENGLLVFDAYAIDGFHSDDDAPRVDDDLPIVTLALGERVYDVYETTTWSRASQRLEVEYLYRPRGRGRLHRQRIDHRYLLVEQLEPVCARSGLEVVEALGGFDGAPLRADSEHMVCIARARRR